MDSPTILIERRRYEDALSDLTALRKENRQLRLLSITAWEIGKEAALHLDNLRLAAGTLLVEVEPLDSDVENTRSELISPVSPGMQTQPEQITAGAAVAEPADERRSQGDMAGKRAQHPLAEQRRKLDERLARLRRVRKRRLDELEQKMLSTPEVGSMRLEK